MARLLPFLVLAVIAIIVMIARQHRTGGGPARGGRAWRPRAGARTQRGQGSTHDGPFVVRLGDVAGVRDAYSGAPIDASKPLVRCANCLAYFHSDSVSVLARDNGGRCASCGSRDFRAVTVARA